MLMNDLYIFVYALAILLLSVGIIAGITAIWCAILLKYKKLEHEMEERKKQENAKQEKSEDEKRRERNAELIKKYMR